MLKEKNSFILGAIIIGAISLVLAIFIYNKGHAAISNDTPLATQTIRVIDGDTIELDLEKVRLYGIDAPEKGQPCKRNNSYYDCGATSKYQLEIILVGAKVKCTKKGKDKWGRFIAQCLANNEDIGRIMVRQGWALAYRQYSSAYIKDEEFAQTNKLGIWSTEFAIPSEWRKSSKGDKL